MNVKDFGGKKSLKCDVCDYSCSQKGTMKTHVSMVHEEKKPFKCDNCDYSCSLKSQLTRHVAAIHEGKKRFKCDICHYRFSEKVSMLLCLFILNLPRGLFGPMGILSK